MGRGPESILVAVTLSPRDPATALVPTIAFECAGLSIEPLQRSKLLLAAKPGLLHSRLQDANGFVINLDRNGIGVPVLAAMGERKPRGIGKAERRAVNDLGHHGKSLHGACADAGS